MVDLSPVTSDRLWAAMVLATLFYLNGGDLNGPLHAALLIMTIAASS